MEIKAPDIFGWFIREYINSKTGILDKPGFIVSNSVKKNFYYRQLFFPESFIVELENSICNKYGQKGEETLYSIGKKYGRRFSKLTKFFSIKTESEKSFMKLVKFFLKYLECTVANNIELKKLDIKNKVLNITYNKFVVCNINGRGHVLSEGTAAALWSHMIDDETVEGKQIKCQGKGDELCEAYFAPLDMMKEKRLDVYTEQEVETPEPAKQYIETNQIRPTQFAQYSFKYLLDTKFFKYKYGIMTLNKMRHFLMEISFSYILEKELKKLDEKNEILFNEAFNFGKKIVDKEKRPKIDFISSYLSSIGWGDMKLTKKEGYKLLINYFPWTKYSDNSDYVFFRGLLSGLISAYTGKEIIMGKFTKKLNQGNLQLRFIETEKR